MRRRLILLTAIGLIAAACGAGESASTFETAAEGRSTPSATAAPTDPDTAELSESDYPDITVADLAGGELNLRELVLEEEPVLLWFWAPH